MKRTRAKPAGAKRIDTSWNRVAGWYAGLLAGEGTYQKDLILPNLVRLMDIQPGDAVLDLACGPGFFAREFAARGARVTGVDASQKLIDAARREEQSTDAISPGGGPSTARASAVSSRAALRFFVARAHRLPFLKNGSMQKISIVLAVQNIENVGEVFAECARVLGPAGEIAIVMNHPAFRVPKQSAWGWDAELGIQFRRVDRYLSELKAEIEMHPGVKAAGRRAAEQTVSFHRPLQYYVKALRRAGFAVTALEEWNSNRKSSPGPRAAAEDRARKEIPLFLAMIGKKSDDRTFSASPRSVSGGYCGN